MNAMNPDMKALIQFGGIVLLFLAGLILCLSN